ncbi:MAG: glycosyltransferase [Saprospiraceae bacterium]|nr:glycosyltransferase [Saprospiraceae bacterium]
MFSILIPVFNYPVSDLVHKLLHLGRKLDTPFEIILGDDGSPDVARTGIEGLDKIPEITIYRMNHNTGRSAIRNFWDQKRILNTSCFWMMMAGRNQRIFCSNMSILPNNIMSFAVAAAIVRKNPLTNPNIYTGYMGANVKFKLQVRGT